MPEIFGAALMGGGSGPAFAAIGVIYPAGATCTCSYGGKTLTAKDTSGRALFLVPSAGQWLVKATNGGQEVEDTVSITTQGQVASVTLAFFSATIQATFPADCTSVTCTKDSTVLSVPSGELASGSYMFSVHETGEWTLYATNSTKEKTVTVNVTEEKAYTASLAFDLNLFSEGEDNTAVTGGWEGSSKNAADIQDSNLGFSVNTDTSGFVGITTKQAVDVTEFSTLKTKVEQAVIPTSCNFGLADDKMGNPSTKISITNGGVGEISVDISQVSGSKYVTAYCPGPGSAYLQFDLRFSRIWLE